MKLSATQSILLDKFYKSSSVYRFPNYSLPKTEWKTNLQVRCGWAKTWDPASVLGCVDPRGCQPPPPRTSEVWGSYDDDEIKSLEVGIKYWYSCRAGMFQVTRFESDHRFSPWDLDCEAELNIAAAGKDCHDEKWATLMSSQACTFYLSPSDGITNCACDGKSFLWFVSMIVKIECDSLSTSISPNIEHERILKSSFMVAKTPLSF